MNYVDKKNTLKNWRQCMISEEACWQVLLILPGWNMIYGIPIIKNHPHENLRESISKYRRKIVCNKVSHVLGKLLQWLILSHQSHVIIGNQCTAATCTSRKHLRKLMHNQFSYQILSTSEKTKSPLSGIFEVIAQR